MSQASLLLAAASCCLLLAAAQLEFKFKISSSAVQVRLGENETGQQDPKRVREASIADQLLQESENFAKRSKRLGVPLLMRDKHRMGKISSVYLIENFVSREKEAELLARVAAEPRKDALFASAIETPYAASFGFETGPPHGDFVRHQSLPDWLDGICCAAGSTGAFSMSAQPNHVLVNKYQPGQGIKAHSDGPLWDPLVATLSLGSGIVFDIHARGKLVYTKAMSLVLPPRSLLIMEGQAYEDYLHAIEYTHADKLHEGVANWDASHAEAWLADGWLKKQLQDCGNTSTLIRGERVSLTLRHAAIEGRKSREFLENALASHPEGALQWSRLGAIGGGVVAGKNYSASECFNRAESANWFTWAQSGGAVKDGETYSAMVCFQSGLSLNPHEPQGWFDLGIRGGGEVNGQRFSQKDCLQKAITLDPQNSLAWAQLSGSGGGVINGTFCPEDICKAKAATLIEHEQREMMAHLGPELYGMNQNVRFEETIEALNNTVSLRPTESWVWWGLGLHSGGGEVNGRTYSPKQCYERALSLNPNHDYIWADLGFEGGGIVGRGEFDGQRYSRKECFEQGLSVNPTNADLWIQLAKEGGGVGNGQRYSSRECFAQVLSFNPTNVHSWLGLGSVGGGVANCMNYSVQECFEIGMALNPAINMSMVWEERESSSAHLLWQSFRQSLNVSLGVVQEQGAGKGESSELSATLFNLATQDGVLAVILMGFVLGSKVAFDMLRVRSSVSSTVLETLLAA